MAVKIRLSRHGRKDRPFYHIVVADSRAPRDGRFIERLGSYDPLPNPAQIDIDVDRALLWLNRGAQPTPTARRILSYKGVLLKRHLQGGVAKGAFDQAEADRRWEAWRSEKDAKIASVAEKDAQARAGVRQARHEAEVKKNEARAEALRQQRAEELKKQSAEAEAAAAAAAAEAQAAEESAGAEATEAAAE